MEPQPVPHDGRPFLLQSTPGGWLWQSAFELPPLQEEQVSQLGEVQSRADLVDGSFVVAMTLCSIGVDKIFCQKGITNTDLVRSLGAHGICIMSYASLGSAYSAASRAVHDGTGCPSFILSNSGHLWSLRIIVPPVSTRNLFVFMPIGLEREAISIYVIPSSLFRLLHEATSSGTQLYLNIFSDALQQTVSMLEANYLISVAWKSAKLEALLQECRGFPRSTLVHPFQPYPMLRIWRGYNPYRSQTANPTAYGGDDGELQLLSTAAPFGEAEAYSPREYWAYSAQQKLLIAGSEGASTSQTAPFDHSHQRHEEHLVDISGQDILIPTVQTDHGIRPADNQQAPPTPQVGPSAPTIVKCLHNGWLWVQRRIKREVSYPAQIERVLYNGDVFWKYGISMAGLALTVEELGNVKGLDALKPSVPCLYILMLGSLVCMNVGQSLKTTFPEGSVQGGVVVCNLNPNNCDTKISRNWLSAKSFPMPANKAISGGLQISSPAGDLDSGGTRVRKPDNQLIAGYLAHEFLTRGTLFGHRFQTTGGEETRAAKKRRVEGRGAPVMEIADGDKKKVYMEVTRLLREEGNHLSGIVNPYQLAVHLQIV